MTFQIYAITPGRVSFSAPIDSQGIPWLQLSEIEKSKMVARKKLPERRRVLSTAFFRVIYVRYEKLWGPEP